MRPPVAPRRPSAAPPTGAPEPPVRSRSSRLLHAIDRLTAHPGVAAGVVVVSLVWVLISTVSGFPGRVETIFQTLVAALTLAMVFVIQHTQTREQRATQRKLDELLRAAPQASNTLIAFEEASDDEIDSAGSEHRDLRARARARAEQSG